jgi:hypothetical protein
VPEVKRRGTSTFVRDGCHGIAAALAYLSLTIAGAGRAEPWRAVKLVRRRCSGLQDRRPEGGHGGHHDRRGFRAWRFLDIVEVRHEDGVAIRQLRRRADDGEAGTAAEEIDCHENRIVPAIPYVGRRYL